MLDKIKQGINQRKARVFSVFLACSFVIWLVSNLSESYESRALFGLEYDRVPEGLALEKGIQQQLRLKLRASGFRFLTRSFGEKSLTINLNSLNEDNNGAYYLTRSQLSGQIEKQLTNAVSLLELELDSDTLYIAAYPLKQKTVPIRPNLQLNVAKNYRLYGEVEVIPDSVVIEGPEYELSKTMEITTQPVSLQEVSSDFSEQTSLLHPESLMNSTLSASTVLVKGEVDRFSEQEIRIEISRKGIPDSVPVQLFPENVSLICRGRPENLKKLSPASFRVETVQTDLNEWSTATSLALQVTKQPDSILSVRIVPARVRVVRNTKQ